MWGKHSKRLCFQTCLDCLSLLSRFYRVYQNLSRAVGTAFKKKNWMN
jgi:hypothetical protein